MQYISSVTKMLHQGGVHNHVGTLDYAGLCIIIYLAQSHAQYVTDSVV